MSKIVKVIREVINFSIWVSIEKVINKMAIVIVFLVGRGKLLNYCWNCN